MTQDGVSLYSKDRVCPSWLLVIKTSVTASHIPKLQFSPFLFSHLQDHGTLRLSYNRCRPSHLPSSNPAVGITLPFPQQAWSISCLVCGSNLQTLGVGNESGKSFPMEIFTPVIYACIISQGSVILTRHKVLVKM